MALLTLASDGGFASGGGLPIILLVGMFAPVIALFLGVIALLFLACMSAYGHGRVAVGILLGIILAPAACIAVDHYSKQYFHRRMNAEIARITTEYFPSISPGINTIGIDRRFLKEYIHSADCNAACRLILRSTNFRVESSESTRNERRSIFLHGTLLFVKRRRIAFL